MRIQDVQPKLYHYRSERPLGDANYPEGRQEWTGLAVFIHTDEGITGHAVGNGSALKDVAGLATVLEGEDPRNVRGLWQKMRDYVFKQGNAGTVSRALSVLDTALWDLKAKIAQEPLWRLLGAREPRVKAYASGIDMCLSDEELSAYYRSMAEQGVDVGKLKVGVDQADDLRRLEIMRDALSAAASPSAPQARPGLSVDVNEYWYPKQAVRKIREIEQHFDLLWVEEPVGRTDYSGLRQVSDAINAAVATGENLYDPTDYAALVERGAADILQIGVTFAGGSSGVTGCLEVASVARAHQVALTFGFSPGNIMAHAAAASGNCMMMEVVGGIEPCFTVDNRIEDGYIVLGDTPGLGLTFDETRLDELVKGAPEAPLLIPGRGAGGDY